MSQTIGARSRTRTSALVVALMTALALGSAGCCCDDDDGNDNGHGNGGTAGGGPSLVGGGWGNFQGMATTNYYGMFHGFRGTAYDQVKSRVGVGGTLTDFSGAITEAPPAGSWDLTLFRNGAAEAVACSIGVGATSCLDAAGCVDVAAGDEIAVRVVPTGATANAGGPRWTAVLTPGASCP